MIIVWQQDCKRANFRLGILLTIGYDRGCTPELIAGESHQARPDARAFPLVSSAPTQWDVYQERMNSLNTVKRYTDS